MNRNLNNFNAEFDYFPMSDFNKHWSWSLFMKNNYICNKILQSNSKIVFDVGCGKGYVDKMLKENYNFDGKIYLFDFENDSVSGEEFIQCDLNLGVPDIGVKSDFVICSELIEHIDREVVFSFVESLWTSIENKGKLALSTPNPQKETGQEIVWPESHDFEYSRIEILKLFNDEFKIIQEFGWSLDEDSYYRFFGSDDKITSLGYFPQAVFRAISAMFVSASKCRQIVYFMEKL